MPYRTSYEAIKAAPEAPESLIPKEKSIDEVIHELSVKHSQNEVLVRKIIFCESSFNPKALNTKAVVGEDVGLFQINTHFHQARAEKMGLDIYQWQDNLEFGFYLLKTQGTRPWGWSAHCWK